MERNRGIGRDVQRALLVTIFYNAISLLMVDALVGPDQHGRFRLEQSDDLANNSRGSEFQSLHHLFCNITETPLDVLVCQPGPNIRLGTGIYRLNAETWGRLLLADQVSSGVRMQNARASRCDSRGPPIEGLSPVCSGRIDH